MADELQISSTMIATVGGNKLVEHKESTARFDVAGNNAFQNVQDIGFAAHEALTIPADCAGIGAGIVKNLDPTNFIELGVDVSATFYPLIKLLPGMCLPVYFAIDAVYAKADTASCQLLVKAIQE